MTTVERKKRFRSRARRVLTVSVAVVGVLVAARIGVFPDAGYRALYWLVAAPGRAAGTGEQTAIAYFEATCRPYRYPREVKALMTLGERQPDLARTIFICGK